jgi:putative ABC transport system permease protein
MPADRRAILLGDGDMTDLLGRLRDQGQSDLFGSRLRQLMPGRYADTEREVGRLAKEAWPRLEGIVGRVRDGQAVAIAAVRSAYPGRELLDMLIAPPPGFFETVKEAGFQLAGVNVGALAGFASLAADRASVESALGAAAVRAGLAQRIRSGSSAFSTDEVFRWLLGRSGDAAWLAEALTGSGAPIAAARLTELANYYDRLDRLQRVADEGAAAGPAALPLEGGTGVLLLLAVFVCVVGVANAMLMSVTERFTEIATMKCLGAMDGFVMLMFVFEAAIQGLVGGIIGVALGTMLAFGRSAFEFGSLLAAGPPVPARIVLALAASLLTGVALAVVAAIGPSLVAARLAPMEAMRVE